MNQARNRSAGNTLFMRIACPGHVIRPLLWVVLSRSLHVKALEFTAFVIHVWENERIRLNLINQKFLKITVTHAVCTWRCWTLPLLWFERERMQLVAKSPTFGESVIQCGCSSCSESASQLDCYPNRKTTVNKNGLRSRESRILGDKFYCQLVLLWHFFVWNSNECYMS